MHGSAGRFDSRNDLTVEIQVNQLGTESFFVSQGGKKEKTFCFQVMKPVKYKGFSDNLEVGTSTIGFGYHSRSMKPL